MPKRKVETSSDESSSESDNSSGHSTSESEAEVKKSAKKKVVAKKEEKPAKEVATKKQKIDATTSKTTKTEADSDPNLISNFRVSNDTRLALASKGILAFFPIQKATFDPIFDGTDLIGRAKTGTGKTFAFAVPVVERLLNDFRPAKQNCPYVICMAPTRELAKQIAADFELLSKRLKVECVYGGVDMNSQKQNLYKGVHIVVGTPGRVKDMIQRQMLSLTHIDYVILDEADEMLKIGFKDDVEEILSNVPQEKDRQTLLFSATLPAWVKGIVKSHMKPDHITVDLVKEQKTSVADTITYYAVPVRGTYTETLESLHSIYAPEGGRTIVFCGTKATCSDVANTAKVSGKAIAIHGDISQKLREEALASFKTGRYGVLVATNVAARGLDIPKVDLVIQMGMPQVYEDFVHRSGRTGRAGRQGICILAYTRRDEQEVARLAKVTGINFKQLAPPNDQDKIVSLMNKAKASVEEVDPQMAQRFKKAATQLIETQGAEVALAAALAHIAGYAQQPLGRSFLYQANNSESANYTTLGWKKHTENTKALEAEIQMLGVQLSKYLWGAEESYFDVPTEDARNLIANNKELFIPKSIPYYMRDQMDQSRGPNTRSGGRNDGRSQRGGRGGYGGRGDRSQGDFGNSGRNSGGRGGRGGRDSRGRGRGGSNYGSGTSFASSQKARVTTFDE